MERRIDFPNDRIASVLLRTVSLVLGSVALNRDAEAVSALTSIVTTDEPPLRLKAAEALGRIGSPRAVPALLESLRRSRVDRFLEHALIYALIGISDRPSTLAALTDPNPSIRRAGLIAMDQMPSGTLTRELVPCITHHP